MNTKRHSTSQRSFGTEGRPDMCLAIPMQVKTIADFQCVCEARGVEREVSLFMMQDQEVVPGDFVLVHVGYAIQKISADDAAESWQLFDQILEHHA
jgi:hydrogenase expression/formation protein HypC